MDESEEIESHYQRVFSCSQSRLAQCDNLTAASTINHTILRPILDGDLIGPLENLRDPSSQSCSNFHDGPEQIEWNECLDFADQFLFAQAFRVLAHINWDMFNFALNNVTRLLRDCPEIVQFAEENMARLKIHRAFFTALE